MIGLRKILEEEEKRLSRIERITSQRLAKAPEGSLRVTSSKGKVQYMYVREDDCQKGGTYIRKADIALAERLAQKEYDRKVQALVGRRLKQLRRILADFQDDEVERVFQEETKGRKQLLLPVEEPWEQRLRAWAEEPYRGKEFFPGTPEIYTKQGERVRSKSEKILADTFFDLGIPYKYECPLKLADGHVVYPDFTFLSPRTGKEIYWEHDGRMDDPEYAGKAIRKIDSYVKSEIFPGENLILTYETGDYVLNATVVNQFIQKYLL